MAKKSDKKVNGYNITPSGRLGINVEISKMIDSWPEGIRITMGKIEDALELNRDFLRHVISVENRLRILDLAERVKKPRGNWKVDPAYLEEFPAGSRRPYGQSLPSDDELRELVTIAIEIAGPFRVVHRDALAKMAACNGYMVYKAMPKDAAEAIKRHNRSASERTRSGCVSVPRILNDDFEQIEIRDIMNEETNFGWIARKMTADSNLLVKKILKYYAELPLELQQQEEDTAFDALLCATGKDGKYARKVALLVVDKECDGRWAVDSVGHNEIAATADLLRAELVYLLRSGDELVHVVRKANMIVPEVGSERTDVTPV